MATEIQGAIPASRGRTRSEPSPDVVSVRSQRRRLASSLREASGFRVDGPEGRVGVLAAVAIPEGDLLPDHIDVVTGLFIKKVARVSFADVAGVDPVQRRVRIRIVPEWPRKTRRETARRVRRFVRTGRA